MAATYNPSLPSNKDKVRLHIGDTNTTTPYLQDEEIEAILADQTATGKSAVLLASAECLEAILVKFWTQTGGVYEKQTMSLRRRFGSDSAVQTSIESLIDRFRKRAAGSRAMFEVSSSR